MNAKEFKKIIGNARLQYFDAYEKYKCAMRAEFACIQEESITAETLLSKIKQLLRRVGECLDVHDLSDAKLRTKDAYDYICLLKIYAELQQTTDNQ